MIVYVLVAQSDPYDGPGHFIGVFSSEGAARAEMDSDMMLVEIKMDGLWDGSVIESMDDY